MPRKVTNVSASGIQRRSARRHSTAKLDVNVKPAIGNEYTLSTCQLDFCLPARLTLTYIDGDGTEEDTGRSSQSNRWFLDRFMAYILEETKEPAALARTGTGKILPVKNEDED